MEVRAAGRVHSGVRGVQSGRNVEDVAARPQGEPSRITAIVIAVDIQAHRSIVEPRVTAAESGCGDEQCEPTGRYQLAGDGFDFGDEASGVVGV